MTYYRVFDARRKRQDNRLFRSLASVKLHLGYGGHYAFTREELRKMEPRAWLDKTKEYRTALAKWKKENPFESWCKERGITVEEVVLPKNG
jgi:hypothetical protein